MKKKSLDNKGQAMVEFVVVVPIFLILVAAGLYGAQIFTNKIVAQSAAASACRNAVVSESLADAKQSMKSSAETVLKSRVRNGESTAKMSLSNGFNQIASGSNYMIGYSVNGGWEKGSVVKVEVVIRQKPLFNYLSFTSSNIRAKMAMKVEQ